MLTTAALETKNNERTLTFIRQMITADVKPNSASGRSSTNPSAAGLIDSSEDLLTEIFLRLPVITVIRLTSVSKQWSLFIKSRSFGLLRNPNPDPPSGLFFEGWDARFKYHYVPLDFGNMVNRPPFTTHSGAIKILQSCNGFLLCVNDFQKYYVYNPTTNRFATLPELNNFNPDGICCMTLAFDPSKSSHYKVVCNYMYGVMMIEIYSSKSGKWKISNQRMDDLVDLDRGVYGHNTVHWMSFPNRLVYLKLDEELLRRGSPENSVWPEMLTTAALETKNNERTLTFIRQMITTDVKPNSASGSSSSNPSAADLIDSSEDLLTEIFLRLPVISLIRLTSVSKQWNLFIKSRSFGFFRNPSPDPPSGLFFEGWDARFKYHYVPLDFGNMVNRPPFTTLHFDSGAIRILQSCNGLLLCVNDFQKYYVYNPTTNRFATLPELNNFNPDGICCMTLAFDPSRSSHYKVVCNYMYGVMMIEIYSSKSGKWKISKERMDDLVDLDRGVYGHNAVHWMSFPNRLVYLKLDEELLRYIDIDTPDTTIYGTILDEFLTESSDGMLLVVRCCKFRGLNVYEIDKDYSEWSIKYHVDLEDVIRVYPSILTRLGLHFVVQSLVLGGTEEDSFIVLELPGKLIQYKFMLKTISQLCDFTTESRRCTHGGFFPKTIFQLSDFTPENRRFINGNCFHFIPSLAAV